MPAKNSTLHIRLDDDTKVQATDSILFRQSKRSDRLLIPNRFNVIDPHPSGWHVEPPLQES